MLLSLEHQSSIVYQAIGGSILKVIAVIPTLKDDPTETIQKLQKQTVSVPQVLVAVGSEQLFQSLTAQRLEGVTVVYVKPDFSKSLGARIGYAVNAALKRITLQDYDYLLKVDADTILPPNFIEANLKNDTDLTGIYGFAMLLRTSTFLKALKGKWPEALGEDTFIVHLYLRNGYSIKEYLLPPSVTREASFHPWRYHFTRGVATYKLGYEPFHAFAFSLDFLKDHNILFIAIGFLVALFRREQRYEFADWIFRAQLRELLNFRRLAAHSQATFFKGT